MREAGTDTALWPTLFAFLILVSISATGSVMVIFAAPFLPTGFLDARYLALIGELPETDAA
jgi:hypothetical protein